VTFNSNVQDSNDLNNGKSTCTRSEKEINREISAIIRQITASVSFLPILDSTDMSFNVLCYTSKSVQPFDKWIDSDGKLIESGEQIVGLRSFSTGSHAVGGMVSYCIDDDQV
jgi:mitotic spindle assembly checkpoint protein MAD2